MDLHVQSVIICFVPVFRAAWAALRSHTAEQLYFSDTWQLQQKCANKDVLLKTTVQFCLMTMPITGSAANTQAQCGVRSGKLFGGNKRKRKEGWVPGWHFWDSKIDGSERRRRKKITQKKAESSDVTSFHVNLLWTVVSGSFRQQQIQNRR